MFIEKTTIENKDMANGRSLITTPKRKVTSHVCEANYHDLDQITFTLLKTVRTLKEVAYTVLIKQPIAQFVSLYLKNGYYGLLWEIKFI